MVLLIIGAPQLFVWSLLRIRGETLTGRADGPAVRTTRNASRRYPKCCERDVCQETDCTKQRWQQNETNIAAGMPHDVSYPFSSSRSPMHSLSAEEQGLSVHQRKEAKTVGMKDESPMQVWPDAAGNQLSRPLIKLVRACVHSR